jgi:hypothetical protein
MADAGKKMLSAAREALARPVPFEEFLGKLSARDRANAEKRVSVLEAEGPERAGLWKRLVCSLTTLAPHAAKLVGKQTVQFYVADGKYRMQVFALEDLQDGNFTVYCPDVLEEVIKAGVVGRPKGEPNVYPVGGAEQTVRVESLDKNSLNPAAHYKDLTGWNRKALKVTLPASPSEGQVGAVEVICAVAASHFVKSSAGGPTA